MVKGWRVLVRKEIDMNEELIKTGDFAKMCAVTKKALYVYEAKGLLKPAVVKDNGYRYYRLEQVDQVATIRLLEKLGSSLQEVGDFFALKDLNERQKYLGKQQEAVEREMAELGKIKSSLEFFDQRISDLKQTGLKKVVVETCPEEYLEVSPFRHGVSLNPISFGPRYGVIVDDFEKAEISRFFKVVEKKRAITSKRLESMPAFTRKWRTTMLLAMDRRHWNI